MIIFNYMIQAGFLFARLVVAMVICLGAVSFLYHAATFIIFWLAANWPTGL